MATRLPSETKRVIIDTAYLAPAAPQTDVYTTTTTMRSPVPPPALSADDELPPERVRDTRDLTRDERTVRSDEIMLDRRLADSDEPLPPEGEPLPPRDRPRVDRRDYDDYPDRPA